MDLLSSVASFSGFVLYLKRESTQDNAQDAVTRRKACRERSGHGRLRCCHRVCSFVYRTRDWYSGRPLTLVLIEKGRLCRYSLQNNRFLLSGDGMQWSSLNLLQWPPGSAGQPRVSWSSAVQRVSGTMDYTAWSSIIHVYLPLDRIIIFITHLWCLIWQMWFIHTVLPFNTLSWTLDMYYDYGVM